MVQVGRGVILNISSIYGIVAAPNRAAYCATKAAVAMLSKALAIDWAGLGVRVNALAPGYVETDLTIELVKQGRIDLQALHGAPRRAALLPRKTLPSQRPSLPQVLPLTSPAK
jgi:NAD(P)-dependent dehydrogenase (short-subunit alcohol dehydrogenase family)